MNINGMQGVQMYDLELVFGGQYDGTVEAVFLETEGQSTPVEVFSGGASQSYDAETNTTKVMGRCSCPPFGSNSVAYITLYYGGVNSAEFQLRS